MKRLALAVAVFALAACAPADDAAMDTTTPAMASDTGMMADSTMMDSTMMDSTKMMDTTKTP